MKSLLSITEAAPLWQQLLLLYLGVINVTALVSYGLDKFYACRNKWRIPERRLLLLAAAGGSVGALLGMCVFRHKIRKWKFRILVPLFTAVHIGSLGYLFWFWGSQQLL